jgi:hypothetical protein
MSRLQPIQLLPPKRRNTITAETRPLLVAINAVLDKLRAYWPVSLRTVHYNLLNDPPLINAYDKRSRYANTPPSNRHLVDIGMRGRVTGLIDEDAIDDETRPVVIWNVHPDATSFRAEQLEHFLAGYQRDLLQSQPDYIELLVEKNTVANLLEPVAAKYGMVMTSGRGFASYPPRRDMRNRFLTSSKHRLVLVVVSDFDPAGETIAESYARSMRDDFGIEQVVAYKTALTQRQVKTMHLPTSVEMKEDSTHKKYFERLYGRKQACYELEALAPATLQAIVGKTIEKVLDMELFGRELRHQAREAKALARERKTLVKT